MQSEMKFCILQVLVSDAEFLKIITFITLISLISVKKIMYDFEKQSSVSAHLL